jgi:putative aldouronate transport system substrate-binding protein
MSKGLTRRAFIHVSGVSALLLGAACTPAAPSTSSNTNKNAGASGGSSSGTKGSPLPGYVPFTGGPKADFHTDDPRYDDGFDNYPATPFKAVAEKPGAGGTVNILNRAYYPPPTPFDMNPTWQEINRQINANMAINVIPGGASDYQVKFASITAGGDLPDIMHIYNGYALAPNLQGFFKSNCADLAPYLAGDAAREYPYLANIPTYAWKNSVCSFDGGLYMIPIQRHLPIFPGFGGYFFANTDVWSKEIGEGYTPKDAADLKRILMQLTRPQEGRWGIGNQGTAGTAGESGPFGLGTYAATFGAPHNWKLDPSGKLIRNRETEEYKAAVGYLRDLMAAGVFPPDVATITQSRGQHAEGRFVMAVEGYGNAWIDLLQRGARSGGKRFHMLKPFPASAGGKPQAFLSHGFISMNAFKKASPDRIKELLRIMNFLAAPFGSQEDLLLTYGLKDQDYTLDPKGNPVPTPDGIGRAGYVPWRYIAQHPYVNYQADLPGFAKAAYDAQQMLMPISVSDPTDGYFSATAWGKGQTADVHFQDGLIDLILGRRQMSEYDDLVKAWQTEAGETVRKELMESMAAAKA